MKSLRKYITVFGLAFESITVLRLMTVYFLAGFVASQNLIYNTNGCRIHHEKLRFIIYEYSSYDSIRIANAVVLRLLLLL